MPNVIVGVDAGGSKTAVAHRLGDGPVRILTAEGANASTLGAERAASFIASLIERTLDGAHPHAVFVGMAGGGTAEIAGAVREGLLSRFDHARVAVGDDAAIALRANVPAGDGAVLVSGTGSIAYAERAEHTFRCGGFGHLLGDEGSGFSVGTAAIKHLLRALDGRAPHDGLTGALQEQFDAHDPHGVLAHVHQHGHPATTVAGAAKTVLTLAAAGERSATKIVQAAALDLFELVKAVVRKAELAQTGAPVALAGGMLAGNSMLSYLLETRLLNEFPAMPVIKTANAPVTGALMLAQRLLE